MNATTQRIDREFLTPSQRFGEMAAIIVMLLFFSFFVYHQAANTGFFTAKFGSQEMFFFYGPMLLSLAAPLIRAMVGRRNPSRPAEAVTNLFQTVAAVWLLVVFPFNFAHLADALPSPLHFVLAWVNNDIGRLVMIIQIIICPIVALVRTWQYFAHHWREPQSPWHARPAL
jgi:hypothetical protein